MAAMRSSDVVLLMALDSNSPNADFIATPPPPPPPAAAAPVSVGHDDELHVDFDALSAESASQAFQPKRDLSSFFLQGPRKPPRQAQWFPYLLSPPYLDGSYPGDVGFDPLGLGRNKATLARFRVAEVKHSRLAMLAAAGWPLAELWHRQIASALGLESLLSGSEGSFRVLAMAYGGGGQAGLWLALSSALFLTIGGLLEVRTFAQEEGGDETDLGFDPLRLHASRAAFGAVPVGDTSSPEEKDRQARLAMGTCEVKHGRLAMLAVLGYAVQEGVYSTAVVDQSPFFFGSPIF
eukprot:gene6255-6896_t